MTSYDDLYDNRLVSDSTVDRVHGCSCCGLSLAFGAMRAECGHVFCEICEGRRHHAPCTICEPFTVPASDGTDVHAW